MKESSYPAFLKKEPKVDSEIMNKIREIGVLWKKSPNKPQLSKQVLDKWESVIGEWLEDKSMPLIARKKTKTEGRGKVISHPSGRKIIISDNTFPDWMFSNILRGKIYELSELKVMLENNELPIAFSFGKVGENRGNLYKNIQRKPTILESLSYQGCGFQFKKKHKRNSY